MFFNRFLALTLVIFCLFACKNSNKSKNMVAREWTIVSVNSPMMQADKDTMLAVYKQMDDSLGKGDSLVNMLLEEEKQQYENSILDFRADGVYVLDVTVQREEGTWSMPDDKSIEFTQEEGTRKVISKIAIKELTEQRMVLISSEEGDTVTMILEPKK
jgi:hypothetical protein